MPLLEFADQSLLEDKGLLSKPDFNMLIGRMDRVFKDFRVSRIRKFLDLQPMTYDDFVLVREEYPIELVPITYQTAFSSSFFPELEQEIIDEMSILSPRSSSNTQFQTEAYGSDWQILQQGDYGSLIVVAHEIEREALQRIRVMKFLDSSVHIDIVPTFSIKPMELASSIHEVQLTILVSLMF